MSSAASKRDPFAPRTEAQKGKVVLGPERPAASVVRCAVCGLRVEDEPTVPIKGVYGEGVRHADNAICMNVLRDMDGDVND